MKVVENTSSDRAVSPCAGVVLYHVRAAGHGRYVSSC